MRPFFPSGALALAGLVLALWCAPAQAQSITLDPTFGTDGRVTFPFIGSQNGAFGLALQRDDKIVFTGIANGTFYVARAGPDGALDTTFGQNGARAVVVGDGNVVRLLPDGRILAAGRSPERLTVARLTRSGDFDATFDGDGIADLTVGGTRSAAYAMDVANDGRIYLAGSYARNGAMRAVVVALNADGSRLAAFGSNGVYTAALDDAEFRAVTLLPDGRVVAGGFARDASTGRVTPVVVRLTAAGALDATLPVPAVETGTILALKQTTDGKLLAAGTLDGDFGVVRYTPGGLLDPAFGPGALSGGTGFVRSGTPGRFEEIRELLTLPDGRLAAVGYARTLQEGVEFNRTPSELAVLLMRADGSPEDDAPVVIPQPDGDFIAFGAAVDSQERLVAVGLFGNLAQQTAQAAAVRLLGVGTSSTRDETLAPALAMGVYPNPTSRRAAVALQLPEAAEVRVVVYDLLGREVAQPHTGLLTAGVTHRLEIPVEGLPAGVYVVRVTAGAHARAQRLTVVR